MLYHIKQIIRSICLPVQILPQLESDPQGTDVLPWEQEQDCWNGLYEAEPSQDDYNLYGSEEGGSSYEFLDDDDAEPEYEEDAF